MCSSQQLFGILSEWSWGRGRAREDAIKRGLERKQQHLERWEGTGVCVVCDPGVQDKREKKRD